MTTVYRAVTRRLELRCWDLTDAPALAALIRANRTFLSTHMAWAEAPCSTDDQLALVRQFRAAFDTDKEYVFGVFARPGVQGLPPALCASAGDEHVILGGCGLHPRAEPGSYEVGYWLREDACGHGVGTELGSALVQIAFDALSAHRVELWCATDNPASGRIAEKLGFTEDGVLRARRPGGDGSRTDMRVFSILPDEYGVHPAYARPARAHDALGRVVF